MTQGPKLLDAIVNFEYVNLSSLHPSRQRVSSITVGKTRRKGCELNTVGEGSGIGTYKQNREPESAQRHFPPVPVDFTDALYCTKTLVAQFKQHVLFKQVMNAVLSETCRYTMEAKTATKSCTGVGFYIGLVLNPGIRSEPGPDPELEGLRHFP